MGSHFSINMEKREIDILPRTKLCILVLVLLSCLTICFMSGSILAPSQYNEDQYLATKCYNKNGSEDITTKTWFYPRGKGSCVMINDIAETAEDIELSFKNVVYNFQMPSSRDQMDFDYSRWQQNLIGLIAFDFPSEGEKYERINATITIDSRLGYRNKGDPEDEYGVTEWKEYASRVENRSLDCVKDRNWLFYNCSTIRLFDLGSLHHDYYLLNIHIINIETPFSKNGSELFISKNIGKLLDLWLVAYNQNGGFTQIWVTLKSIFFLLIPLTTVYFWKKLTVFKRPLHQLEKKLLKLSSSLILFNLPLEYFTLALNVPWIHLLIDFFQAIFYLNLLFFLLLFTTEMKIQDFLGYWKKCFSISIVGCVSIIMLDVMERVGGQLVNPFSSGSWFETNTVNIELALTVITSCVGLIFIFISLMICFQIVTRQYSHPEESWRMTLLMLVTVMIPILTVVEFLISKAAEGAFKWDEALGEAFEYTSGLKTGVFGLWNIYTFALLILLAPSSSQINDDID